MEKMTSDFVKVYSADSRLTAEILLGALTQEKIPAFRQAKGGGSYMDICTGDSVFGEDIYVASGDAQRAMEVIEGIMTKVPPAETDMGAGDTDVKPWDADMKPGETDIEPKNADMGTGDMDTKPWEAAETWGWQQSSARIWVTRIIIAIFIIGLVLSLIFK